MACAYADGHRTTVGVWNVGRDIGGAIFEYRDCRWLEVEGLDLPYSAPLLSYDSIEPFCLHRDAFPLKKYLLRPCKNNSDINVFAAAGFLDFRGVCAFGVLASRFHMFEGLTCCN